MNPSDCELCAKEGGALLWRDDFLRIVSVDEPDYPGFCRVILQRHVAEMSDLDATERDRLMYAVYVVEQSLRTLMRPAKINLASLGNMVPHLHWHVIPRFHDDRHFPAPIWAAPVRAQSAPRSIDLQTLSAHIARALDA
jgi:diadenosine tetraphosphate (Ap4A) HIT family hydrolase